MPCLLIAVCLLAPRPLQPALPQFDGKVVKRGDLEYETARVQYATTSHEEDYGHMDPGAIIYPKNDNDIRKAIAYAREHKLAIAVRTGGHQYSGASSTSGQNIQLDLSETYREYEFDQEASIVTTGVSRLLGSLNTKLQKADVFVPHGQCAHVHIGGHSHTGGYGVPGRAFGLFGDHIIAIRTITADGQVRWIERATTDKMEADLFYATLGGSPGNYGEYVYILLTRNRLSHTLIQFGSLVAPTSLPRLGGFAPTTVCVFFDKLLICKLWVCQPVRSVNQEVYSTFFF